jgi:hypothetical protein
VGVLALLPVAWYGLASSGTAGAFSAVNVGIILTTLYLAMSPVEGGGHHGDPA